MDHRRRRNTEETPTKHLRTTSGSIEQYHEDIKGGQIFDSREEELMDGYTLYLHTCLIVYLFSAAASSLSSHGLWSWMDGGNGSNGDLTAQAFGAGTGYLSALMCFYICGYG
jgi:hypothetical protein